MKKQALFIATALLVWPLMAGAATNDGTTALQQKWAIITYQTPDKDQQEQAITALYDQAVQNSAGHPGKAEPLIWQANILCTKAGFEANAGALDEVTKGRDLLQQAIKINPQALGGLGYTLLGWIYHKVPGWPVAFGDDKLAVSYMEKGLALNPNGLDANFFYGGFLYDTGDYAKAKSLLDHVLKNPSHPVVGLADKGRQNDIRDLLQKVNAKLP